ncbi:MAG: DUF4340 domain-containing protein [Myxococcota bacterium]|nr:DUF4340 domain-containing protein [Myxococcota bacterium]
MALSLAIAAFDVSHRFRRLVVEERKMKELRGALLALVVLGVVAVLYFSGGTQEVKTEESKEIFRFEKHELIRVEIEQPGREPLVLTESEGAWTIEGKDLVASTNMINRIKHQLHDLDARTEVAQSPENPTLYGLGENAIRVKLSLRSDRTISFLAGDPNPSAVSYYIQPIPGDTVYTVKKSAMDYYSLDFDSFREPRFARFDSKDVHRIYIERGDTSERSYSFEKNEKGYWFMDSASREQVDSEAMQRIIAKAASLKARRYIDTEDPHFNYGFNPPVVSMTLEFHGSDTLRIQQGKSFSEGRENLAYYRLNGSGSIYVSRSGWQDLIPEDKDGLRNRKIMNVEWEDIQSITGTIYPEAGSDQVGNATVRQVAAEWVWDDGSIVPGSTPKRVAQAISRLRVLSFEEREVPAQPAAELIFVTEERQQRVVLGGEAEPFVDAEGNSYSRRYLWLENKAFVIDTHLFRVLEDMIREYGRKDTADQEKRDRQNRIKKGN